MKIGGTGMGLAAVFILSVGALVSACDPDTRYRTLSFFFDGVPPPGATPVPRRLGRPKPSPIPTYAPMIAVAEVSPTPGPERPPAEKAATYAEVLAMLPKDADGEIDWVQAEARRLIAPRPSLDPSAPPIEPMDLDVVLQPKDPTFKVVFPHKVHTQSIACESCHPAIFQMQQGADPITMDKIFTGEYCGKCHGTVAFNVNSNCSRCHKAMGGG